MTGRSPNGHANGDDHRKGILHSVIVGVSTRLANKIVESPPLHDDLDTAADLAE